MYKLHFNRLHGKDFITNLFYVTPIRSKCITFWQFLLKSWLSVIYTLKCVNSVNALNSLIETGLMIKLNVAKT